MSPNEEQRPITREDLRQELNKFKDEINTSIREAQAQTKTETQEFVRDAQTEILRAFHAFEKNREVRFARLKAEVSNLDHEANTRIDNIEQRLMAIEERLILGPPRQ